MFGRRPTLLAKTVIVSKGGVVGARYSKIEARYYVVLREIEGVAKRRDVV